MKEIGPNVSGFNVNDIVFFLSPGSWTKEIVVRSESASKVPSLSLERAASLPAAILAWGILNSFKKLQSGDVVVQLATNSAENHAISEIGTAQGLKVLNVTAAELSDPKTVVSKAGGTIKLAVTTTSGKVANSLMKTLSPGGSLVTYNSLSSFEGDIEAVDAPVRAFIFSDCSIHGFDLHSWASSNPAEYRKAVTAVSNLLADGKVTLPAKVFPLSDFQAGVTAASTPSTTSIALSI